MGFYDDPVVDDNSKRSEESVNAVKSLFTKKNGFISREEFPDYGVDLDIELILSESRASSKKFPIQIKSTGAVKTALYGDDTFITLEFKTSRLGYLARRPPSYGIVVIYDEATSTCYFDHVEEILKRLDETDSRDGWRERANVNILIPFNKLNSAELPGIHEKYRARHENSRLLVQEHGKQFGIPSLEFTTVSIDEKVDLKDPAKMAAFLEKHGSMLFNENEYQILIQMLGVTSKGYIDASAELMFLCAITYTQVGSIIEAEYYIRKAKKISADLSSEKNGIIAFSEIRIEFLKGNINYESFLKKFKELSDDGNTIENQLTIEVNILWFKFMTRVEDRDLSIDMQLEIDQLLVSIENADLSEEKRHLLKVYHSETQHAFAIEKFLKFYTQFKIKESLKIKIPAEERAASALQTILTTNAAMKTVFDAYNYAEEKGQNLLKATAALQLGKHFFSLHSALQLMDGGDLVEPDKDKLVMTYTINQNYCFIALNEFIDLYMFQNAREALSTAYDIQQLGYKLTDRYVGPRTPESLMKIIREIESKYDFHPFESAMEKVSSIVENRGEEKDFLKNATDVDLDFFANSLLEAYSLPEDRLQNILHDLRMVKTFEERCDNPNVLLLQDLRHTESFNTHYAQPPLYILRHAKLNVDSKPSSDIEVLLNEFSTILRMS